MNARPKVMPDVVAALTGGAPRRLVAKLDAQPRMAESWVWAQEHDEWTVQAPGGDVVALTAVGGLVQATDNARCSCLLSPRCLHVLAVITLLDVSDATVAAEDPKETQSGEPAVATTLSPEQVDIARGAWCAAAEILTAGAGSAGAVTQAELLRAIHGCRAVGLHRAAAAGLRVVQLIRDLRDERPHFQLSALATQLFDLLDTASTLSHTGEGRAVEPSTIGVARRSYELVGNIRLHGLFTEPVIAPGYAGVVTYLADNDQRIWSLSDVMPAEAGRAVAAYDAAAAIGDASLAHRELCREGLFVQNATASADGRLGSGASVKAVRAGASPWSGAQALWDTPFSEQITQAFSGDKPPVAAFLFGQAQIVGMDGEGIIVAAERGDGSAVAIRCIAPSDHTVLAYRDNLRFLARAQGLRFVFVARILPDLPKTVALLAIGEPDGADENEDRPQLRLPPSWGQRCCLGLDRLVQGHFSHLDVEPTRVQLAPVLDPLDPLRRRLLRFVLGGRETLPPESFVGVEREAALLERRMMPTAASTLRKLARATQTAARNTSGVRRAVNAGDVAEAWRSAMAYERAASRFLRRSELL